ncbi:MAG: four-carbon acid sugar kinase family protein [Synergistaceae bacterium]|jgi:uncharacterized protein YgbK (DUF1537 family)|nr:four-carbon acid sugar kinase family protein [Synergistaceae bacterium]
MIKLLIIADDYTGSLDTGVQFSRKGVSVRVLTQDQLSFHSPGHEGYDALGCDVLVIDTESRHIPPREARQRVKNAASEAMRHGVAYFYKKTDSALRGNIGAELAGLLDAGDIESKSTNCLTFVPAFPKSRRVTVGGVQYIDGVKVAESVFAEDPFSPVKFSSVADIVHLQTDTPTENVTRDAYEKAGAAADAKIIRILDAESMEDIERAGALLKRGGNLHFLAGCAGFAEILPDLLELPKSDLTFEKRGGSILVISGSVNPITLDQISEGTKYGFSTFTLSLPQKLDTSYPDSDACGLFVGAVKKEMEERGRVIIRTVQARKEVPLTESCAREKGIPERELPRRIADNMGTIAARILEETRVDYLAVFGGDTLHSVLSKMRCEGVCPLTEVSSGVVAAKTFSKDQPDHSCIVITKSGGLGERDVLRSINDFVSENAPSP